MPKEKSKPQNGRRKPRPRTPGKVLGEIDAAATKLNKLLREAHDMGVDARLTAKSVAGPRAVLYSVGRNG